MSTNLRELLQERAANSPGLVAARLSQVHRRIAQRRRRRMIGTAAAALVLIAMAAVTLEPVYQSDGVPPTLSTSPPVSRHGFPEYQGGARFTASAVAELPQPELTLTYVPKTLDLRLSRFCSASLYTEIRVNGKVLFSTQCDPEANMYGWPPRNTPLANYGVRVGEPATFTMTPKHLVGHAGFPPTTFTQPLPDHGSYALAIGERIAFEHYPLPPRPAKLMEVDVSPGLPAIAQIDSDPSDPLTPMSATFTLPSPNPGNEPPLILIAAQTPGSLTATVEGATLGTYEIWDYKCLATLFSLDDLARAELAEGDRVTITVVPEHMTGAWSLLLVGDT